MYELLDVPWIIIRFPTIELLATNETFNQVRLITVPNNIKSSGGHAFSTAFVGFVEGPAAICCPSTLFPEVGSSFPKNEMGNETIT